MQLAMYTTESANWYALLNKAQAAADYYFHPIVENYLVYVFATMSNDLEFLPGKTVRITDHFPYTKRERELLNTRKIGERSLILSGLFPDQAQKTGVPLVYLMERGKDAYAELAKTLPDNNLYTYFSKHFTKVVDVLQMVSEICEYSHSIDLFQACELWQETGSQRSYSFIQNNTRSFPVNIRSELHH